MGPNNAQSGKLVQPEAVMAQTATAAHNHERIAIAPPTFA